MSRLSPPLAARFEAIRVVGQGGFGQVLAVREIAGGRLGALKRIAFQGDGARELREARVASELRDPGLVDVYEVGVAGDEVYLFMELADGTLEDLFDEEDPTRALELLADAGGGLAALHAAGLVHRDVKPANVLRVGDRGKLADLGLVRGPDLPTLTATGVILGTPDYLAPEQARGERPGPASDIFAYAAVAYRILARRRVYPGDDPGAVVMAAARGERSPLEAAGLPEGPGRQLLEAALSIAPADRPGDVVEVAAALRQLAGTDLRRPAPNPTITARQPESRPQKGLSSRTPRGRRSRARSATGDRLRTRRSLIRRMATFGVALGTAALVAWGLRLQGTPPPPAPPTEQTPEPDVVAEGFREADHILAGLTELLRDPGVEGFMNSRELSKLPPEEQRRRVDDPVVLRFRRFTRTYRKWIQATVAAGREPELDELPSVRLAQRLEAFLYGYRNFLRNSYGFDAKGLLRPDRPHLDPIVAARAKRILEDLQNSALRLAREVVADQSIPRRFATFLALRLHSVTREGTTWRFLDVAIAEFHATTSPEVTWLRADTVVTAILRFDDVLPGRCTERAKWLTLLHASLPPAPASLSAVELTSLVGRQVGIELRVHAWCKNKDIGTLGRIQTALQRWRAHPGVSTDWDVQRRRLFDSFDRALEAVAETPAARFVDEYLRRSTPP